MYVSFTSSKPSKGIAHVFIVFVIVLSVLVLAYFKGVPLVKKSEVELPKQELQQEEVKQRIEEYPFRKQYADYNNVDYSLMLRLQEYLVYTNYSGTGDFRVKNSKELWIERYPELELVPDADFHYCVAVKLVKRFIDAGYSEIDACIAYTFGADKIKDNSKEIINFRSFMENPILLK